MEKSHKIYNLIFDLLLTAGVCFYNDLRFMRFWFLGGRLYHATGFANYRFGLTGKEVCWDFSPLNILHCLQGYDPHAYLKFLCFFCIGILMFFRFVFRAPKLLPRLFARLFCFSAGYIAVVELYNLLFTAAGAVFLDISNWFLYLTGAWSSIAILTLLVTAAKSSAPLPCHPFKSIKFQKATALRNAKPWLFPLIPNFKFLIPDCLRLLAFMRSTPSLQISST